MHKKPTFFIVGAPKCGTTSLYRYLEQHPQIFLPKIKEPNFFAKDLEIKSYPEVSTIRDYLELFYASRDEKAFGDASQFHLYSKVAAKNIYEFAPNAKIIIMLRDPVSMIKSLHTQYLSTKDEDIESFEKVIALEERRLNGLDLPKSTLFPRCMAYLDIAKFNAQIKRYYEVFPVNNIKVILLQDLIVDTKKVYLDTLRFLEVDQNHIPTLLPYNVAQSRNLISTQLRHHLQTVFLREVEELEETIGRDLSSWKNNVIPKQSVSA